VCGIVFFTITFDWLGKPLADLFQNPWLICLPPLLSLYLGLFIGFWSWFIAFLPRGDTKFLASGRNVLIALLAALAWVAQEWTRGWLFGGFGWNGLGVALHANLALIQVADIAGLPGLTFMVAFANVIAVMTVRRFVAEVGKMRVRPHWDFSLMMALIVASFGYGVRVLWHSGGGEPERSLTLRFAAVQPFIPETYKSDPSHIQAIYDTYDKLTHTALAWQPQLLLWPEAATLTDVFDSETYDWLKSIDASTDAAFIFGSFLTQPTMGDYNIAACLTDHGQTLQMYRKIHLVPFGEYIPARHSFPLFAKIAGQLVPGDLEPGKELTIFKLDAPPIRVGPLICFEDTVGDQTRRMAGLGAQLFVNITNDSWFGASPGPYQHLCNAFFRTIENRRPMIRDANTGVTCVIDAEGRVLQALTGDHGNTYFQGILFGTATIPAHPPTTLYMRYGDWLAQLGVLMSAAVIAFRFAGPHRWKRTPLPGGAHS
jgi:apolipoprotein N-acyltransferase